MNQWGYPNCILVLKPMAIWGIPNRNQQEIDHWASCFIVKWLYPAWYIQKVIENGHLK